jgi:hypothetical protein
MSVPDKINIPSSLLADSLAKGYVNSPILLSAIPATAPLLKG